MSDIITNTASEQNINKEAVQDFFGTSHAFIIGINRYQDFPPLKTAVNDAEALAQTLAEHHDYQVHEPLIDASQKEIMELFTEKMPQLVKEGDRVLLYFAGHGISEEREGMPNDGYLAPADAVKGLYDTLIPFDELYKVLDNLPCKHGLLVMDCCFSGAIKWASQSRDVMFDLPEVVYDKRLEKYAREEAWQVITSAGADQKAKDFLSRDDFEGVAHSPFAKALLDALGESSMADLVPETNDEGGKGDGLISVTELFVHLKSVLGGIGELKDQTPGYFTLTKHGNGEFFFMHPKHPLTLPRAPERSPFIGLQPYSRKESYLYFGRKGEISALKDLIESHSLLIFSGTAGGGKTSLLNGGLLPALETSKVKSWNILPEIIGEGSPLEHARVAVGNLKARHDNLLLLDNYTEIIERLSLEELKEFEDFLSNISENLANLKIIVCLRTEDLQKLRQEDIFPQIKNRSAYELPRIATEQVPETVKDICRKVMAQEVLLFKSITQSGEDEDQPVWSNSEGITLLDKIVEDIRYASQVLPLYSLVMENLYRAYEQGDRDDRELSIEDYEALGGAMGILYTHTQAVFDKLETRRQKEAMKKLLLRMIAFGEESVGLAKLEDWQLEFTDEAENETTQTVIKILLDQRILFSHIGVKGNLYYEIAHPQLLDRLRFLGEWQERSEALKLQFELREHVRNLAAPVGYKAFHEDVLKPMLREKVKLGDYANFLKGRSGAYADFWHKKKEKLDPALGYLISRNHLMSHVEADFVQASADVRLRIRKMLSRFQWGISLIMTGLMIAAVLFAIQSEKNRQEAVENARIARINEKKATERLNERLYRDFNEIIASGVRYNIFEQKLIDFDRAQKYWADSIMVDTLKLPNDRQILKTYEMTRIDSLRNEVLNRDTEKLRQN